MFLTRNSQDPWKVRKRYSAPAITGSADRKDVIKTNQMHLGFADASTKVWSQCFACCPKRYEFE
jgi:hypothetical protein